MVGTDRSLDYPSDLLAVAVVTVVTGLFVFVSPLNGTPLRGVLSFGFVLFVPGYAVVAALVLPSDGDTAEGRRWPTESTGDADRTFDRLERLVLSFGVSVALTIVVGLALGLVQGRITPTAIFVCLAAVTAAGVGGAAVRRQRSERPFRSPSEAAAEDVRPGISDWTTAETAVNVTVAAAVVLAAVSVGLGLGDQREDDITGFGLLATDDDGELVASDYPSSLIRGASEPFAVQIDNREGEQVTYTVVVLLQRYEGGESVEETELQQFAATLEDGETRRVNHSVTPEVGSGNYRLTYLLYADSPPTNPSVETAYREVHIWVDVEGGS
ncbi:DUF1616 domain-containing protein [Halobellus rarus]|uniref:DUF1616 domain-containing protein n=1 Tax=Halobellus rarus TaxID=1126237 RepID=A0ABD6CIK9_9EURY|nr:DUF1616 domain-containing protein [Halobellus rarus]